MKRTINIDNDFAKLNPWVQKSIAAFYEKSYLDRVSNIYTYSADEPQRIDEDLRRKIMFTHHNQNDEELIKILSQVDKFPYDEPFWYLLKNVDGFIENNPEQIHRIAQTMYSMTDEEVVVRLESQPKLNQQTGPMFTNWVKREFKVASLEEFKESEKGIIVLAETEVTGKLFLSEQLNQKVGKRPDLIAKVDNKVVIGEAKWVGQSGGNQYKSIREVLAFCGLQRGPVYRIGIIDGYPWLTKKSGRITNDRICVEVQESTYNLMSALILEEYLKNLLR